MKISSLTITNVKSFKNETSIDFDDKLNIFIGPNAGGKSNLLDIIIVVIKNYLIWTGFTKTEDNTGKKKLSHHSPFSPIGTYLERYTGDSSNSTIKIIVEVVKEDLENMTILKENGDKLYDALHSYHSYPGINFIEHWDLKKLHPGQKLGYLIVNTMISKPDNEAAHFFIQYLNYFEIFAILVSEIESIKLHHPYLYFSPYRWVGQEFLRADLSKRQFYSKLLDYERSNSKSITSLLELAAYQVAEVRRNYESRARYEGYENKFKENEKIKLLSTQLAKLGYSWELKCEDPNRNVYHFTLEKNGKEFPLTLASSGEKEILNFFLGIFAFNIQNGLIIIEEPEIHLHPKWLSIVMNLFVDLAERMNNQFIISTHSPGFVNTKTILNVRRVYKDDEISKVVAIKQEELAGLKGLLHIINIQNNEKVFFADKVILTEGIRDRLIFQKLVETYSDGKSTIIEVVEVGGKDALLKYRRFLDAVEVDNYIVADLDYILTIGDSKIKRMFTTDYEKLDRDVLKNKKSRDGEILSKKVEQAIRDGDTDNLKSIFTYIKDRKQRLKKPLGEEEKTQLNAFIAQKKREKIYILIYGEIEDYLPEVCRDTESIIEMLKYDNFCKWFKETKDEKSRIELDKIVFDILGIGWDEREKIISGVGKKWGI